MSENVLSSWHRQGLELATRALETVGAQPPGANGVRTVEHVVSACCLFPAVLSRLRELAWEACSRNPGDVEAWNRAGDELRAAADATLAVLRAALPAAEAAERTADQPVTAHRLVRALAEVERLRCELDTQWFSWTLQDEEEEKAAIARGEGKGVEETFAEAMGVSKEALRERVEQHKRKRKALGWE